MFIVAKKLKTTSIFINRRMDKLCIYTVAHCTAAKIDETEPPISTKLRNII